MKTLTVPHLHDYSDGHRELVTYDVPEDTEALHHRFHYEYGLFFLSRQLSQTRKERRHDPLCATLSSSRTPTAESGAPVVRCDKNRLEMVTRRKICNCNYNKFALPGDIEVSLVYADRFFKTIVLKHGEGVAGVPAAIAALTAQFNLRDFEIWLTQTPPRPKKF